MSDDLLTYTNSNIFGTVSGIATKIKIHTPTPSALLKKLTLL